MTDRQTIRQTDNASPSVTTETGHVYDVA